MKRGDLQIQDLRVIKLLGDAKMPVTTRQIADKLNIELRTVQRIIEVLEELPLPLRRDSQGMGGGIKMLGDYALQVTLPSNLVELAALIVAREAMRDRADGTLVGEAFEQFAERVLLQLKGDQRALCERFVSLYQAKPASKAASATPIARLVHKALDESRVLAIEYVSPGEQRPKRRDLEPHAVWVGKRNTYLVANDRQKAAVRVFALDRIRGASLAETTFTPPRDFDPKRYFGAAVDVFVGEPVALELSLGAEAVRRLGSRLPHEDARLIRRPDGGGVLHWTAPLSDELVSWMFSLGPGVAVTAPKEARLFVRDRLADALASHAVKAVKAPRPKRSKPASLPGPLVRRMIKKK